MATDWRWALLHYLGPGGYPGFRFSDWFRLLRDNRFSVGPTYLNRAFVNTLSTLTISPIAQFEQWRYGDKISKTNVVAPLFILGHWRSGTTFLHQLLALDSQFAFPNLHQVSFPHTFLSTEASSTRLTQFLLPRIRPFDNVRQHWEMPYEDEIAIATLTLRSPYLCGLFPHRTENYDRYLNFDDVPSHEVDEWRAGFMLFLKKLTWKYQRPLVLKSPTHTCRIRLLLELFPNAKFIHIHRNPFDVFQSTIHLINKGIGLTCFQRADQEDWTTRTLRVYRDMYEKFFLEKKLIPDGDFHEIRFEELENDPCRQVQAIYEALSLPPLVEQSKLKEYLNSVAGYRKNNLPTIPVETENRITTEWERCFDEWGYSKIVKRT
ncbi:sulfotransferase [bacterium]|nr:sulfotransferase [bacterium]